MIAKQSYTINIPMGAKNIHARILRFILFLSIATVVLFPLYTFLVQLPAFSALLKENILNEATREASQLSTLLQGDDVDFNEESIYKEILPQIRRLQQDPRLTKLRIFSPSGEIMFSTDPKEIGTINEEEYFRGIVETKRPRMKMIEKNGKSFERQLMTTDVVETYAPIMSGNELLGVLEIYSDITLQQKKLNGVVRRSFTTLFLMAATLLVLVLYSTRRAGRFLRERQRMEEELRALSISDELTGLYNRRGFFMLAEQQMKVAKRIKQGVLLVSADLNGLKGINDRYGHHEGDRALRETADILRKSFRESDIIARIGGDEFVILMMEKPGIGQEVLAARLKSNLDQYNAVAGRVYALSISVGMVSCGPETNISLDELMKRADILMYNQKRNKPAG